MDFELIAVVGGPARTAMQVRKKDTGEIFMMKAPDKENLIEQTFTLQKIQHPFIVGLHYAFETSDKLYLILDFLSGGELFFHLQREGKFDEVRSRFYIAEIGLALGHVHSQNFIYRNLNPEYAVLDKFGHVCLTDIIGLTNTKFPDYLAPECLMGVGHGKAVDWWSLGILLFEMLNGLPPFYSDNASEMDELILHEPLNFTEEFSQEARN